MRYIILTLLGRLLRVRKPSTTSMSFRTLWSARRGNVNVGSDCVLHCRFSLDRKDAIISIGDRCYIGASHIVSGQKVDIESDVIISWGVTINDHDSHSLSWENRASDVTDYAAGKKNWSDVKLAAVRICSRSWIGFNATILKGVTIGEGAVVGACSVVTRDVEPYTIVAGNPAKVVRRLDPPSQRNG